MNRCVLVVVLACLSWSALAQDSPRMAEIAAADQADRRPASGQIDWSAVGPRDAARRTEVAGLLKRGELRTANDYASAGLVFQHGDTAEETLVALSLATIATVLDPSHQRAKWLTAAAWDRILMYRGKPQWYSTQFRRSPDTGKMQLYAIDETAVTDKERAALGVPSLEEARKLPERMSR